MKRGGRFWRLICLVMAPFRICEIFGNIFKRPFKLVLETSHPHICSQSFFSLHSLLCFIVEEENSLLRMMIANNPLILLGSHSSKGSLPLSATLSGPPPLLVQPSQSERTQSTGAIRFILQQCKEHVEAHNTITMRSYQWARIHKLLVTQFPQESSQKVKSVSDKWKKLRS